MNSSAFRDNASAILTRHMMHLDAFPWASRDAYGAWLAQTYYFVCHSTRLLALAASRFTIHDNALHLRCLDHLREERSHETLTVGDLKALGHAPRDYPEFPETRAFYQSQYYLIEHVSPKALFGYILSLEVPAAAKGPAIFALVREVHGEHAARFLKVHSEEDVDHVNKLYEHLTGLSGPDLVTIYESVEQSCALYAAILGRAASHRWRGEES